MFVKKLEMKF